MSETFLDKLRGAWRSKVIWFNAMALTLIPVFGQFVDVALMLTQYLPELKPYLPDDLYKYLAMAVLGANIYLRFKTDRSLAAKAP